MSVYVDVLVAVNYIINLMLLKISSRLLGVVCSQRRLYLAALLGAVGSLVIFLPSGGAAAQSFFKLSLALMMSAAAFGLRDKRRLIKALAATFLVSFVFAGVAAACVCFFEPAGLLYYNGVVYFDLDAGQLILCVAAAYLVLTLLERFLNARAADSELYAVTICLCGACVQLKGFGDTGHRLKEPFSGAPVIICERTAAARLGDAPPERVRVIPCSTVTGGGILEAFRPDYVEICGNGLHKRTTDAYIAVVDAVLSSTYQALIPPPLLRGTQRCQTECKTKEKSDASL